MIAKPKEQHIAQQTPPPGGYRFMANRTSLNGTYGTARRKNAAAGGFSPGYEMLRKGSGARIILLSNVILDNCTTMFVGVCASIKMT